MESAQPQPNLAMDITVMEVMVIMGDTEAMDMASAQHLLNLAMDTTVMEDMVVITEDMGTMVMARGMLMPHLMDVKQFRPNYFSH